jgi:hypothetical protein
MDKYLSGRANEVEAERPIIATEHQGYIHYNKGSVVLYYLKEMIGADRVNTALRTLNATYGYRGAPYPTSLHAVAALRNVTPDSLRYLIEDMFENITLFSNRVETATVVARDGGWDVTVTTMSEKFRADTLGRETAVPLRDVMDVMVFGAGATKDDPGTPIAIQRVTVLKGRNRYTFRVDRQPGAVGIDPFNQLIDRIPDDNVKVL